MPRAYIRVHPGPFSTTIIPRGDLIMKIQKLFAIVLAGSLAIAMSACGSTETAAEKGTDTAAADTTTETADTTTDGNTDLGGTDNTDNSGNTDTNTDIGGNNGGTSNCAAMADFNTCANCFAQENPSGAQAYSGALVQQCLCTNECEADCATECTEQGASEFSDTCNTCFETVANDQQSGCIQGFSGQCQADQNCLAFVQALQTCPQ